MKRQTKGAISNARRAWTKGSVVEAICYVYEERKVDDPEGPRQEPGDDVSLFFHKSGQVREQIKLPLTQMTESELVALRRVSEIAFANALATVQFRDARAAKLLAQGDTSLSRIFREDPRIIIREGESYPTEPQFLLREWEGGDGEELEYNPLLVAPEEFVSSRNPDEEV